MLDLGADSKVYAAGMSLKVPELVGRVDLSAGAVRYYEEIGLLDPPERSKAGYRLWDEGTVERLRFIKGAKSLGLKLRDVRELLEVKDKGQCPCGHTESLVHLQEIDQELKRLRVLRAELSAMAQLNCRSSDSDPWPCEIEFIRRGGETS